MSKLTETVHRCALQQRSCRNLAHVYLPIGRLQTFDATPGLIARAGVEVWPLEEAGVALARQLHERYPSLQARALCHLASCRRRGVREVKTKGSP